MNPYLYNQPQSYAYQTVPPQQPQPYYQPLPQVVPTQPNNNAYGYYKPTVVPSITSVPSVPVAVIGNGVPCNNSQPVKVSSVSWNSSLIKTPEIAITMDDEMKNNEDLKGIIQAADALESSPISV